LNRVECQAGLLAVPKEAEPRTEVLKEGDTFLVTLPDGSIPVDNGAGLGFYHRDTRFLNCLEMSVNGTAPVFLSAYTRDSHFGQMEFTNQELPSENCPVAPMSVHMRVLRTLREGIHQRIRLTGYEREKVEVVLSLLVGADFVDIFEVRGLRRPRRGQILPVKLEKHGFVLGYRGLDGSVRSVAVAFAPAPRSLEEVGAGRVRATFQMTLTPGSKHYVHLHAVPKIHGEEAAGLPVASVVPKSFKLALAKNYEDYNRWKQRCTSFYCDDPLFNQLLNRTVTDIYSLSADYPGIGRIVEAGVPWYAAPFGRDALIVAWQTMWVNPDIACETLYFLARLQGDRDNPGRDEQPGKIIHELRRGEVTACGETPHNPYYGSVDSTLWFIVILYELVVWLGQDKILQDLRPALDRALEWCSRYGDLDEDLFIEYRRNAEKGLINQGWKDSWDAVVDPSGRLAEGPVALVEVQGYYYKALMGASRLYQHLGETARAVRLRNRARKLRRLFLENFWLEENKWLAFALDGAKNRIVTAVSNPGHCLFTGILPRKMAVQVARRLLAPDFFSGWGIRTMSNREAVFNPLSYHNGTVWPHDNAIILTGFRAAGLAHLIEPVATSLYQAAVGFPYLRLPELFCGFARRTDASPVHYPVACNPQAWAVGAWLQILQAMLGLSCHGNQVRVSRPVLPKWINELTVSNLTVGSGRVDLEFTRDRNKTYCSVRKTNGPVHVVLEA
jgi:glycogen debranching enzyme